MNIGSMLKTALLWVVAFVAPYVMDALTKIAVPLFLKALEGATIGTPDGVAKAKQDFMVSWGGFITAAQATSHGTVTKIDDYIMDTLSATTIDEEYAGKIFDLAEKEAQKFFRPTA